MPILPKFSETRNVTETTNGSISKEKIVIVEGNDEVKFFNYFFDHNNIVKNLELKNKVQIIAINGVNNIKKELSVLKNRSGFDIVTSLAVIRDADNSAQNSFDSVKNFLIANNLPYPDRSESFSSYNAEGIKGGIFIIPGEEVSGKMLEDLCLASVQENRIMNLVDNYMSELKLLDDIEISSNFSKTKILVYLASQKKIVNNLGIGSANFDVNHDCFKSLANFFTNI